MNRKEETIPSTLGYLGTNAQYLFVRKLLTDKPFYNEAIGLVKPALFTDKALKNIIKLILQQENVGHCPSLKDVEYLCKQNSKDDTEMAEYKEAVKRLAKPMTEDDGAASAELGCMNFLKAKEIEHITTKALKSINDGYSSEKLENLISNLQEIEKNESVNEGWWLDDVDSVINKSVKPRIKLGIPVLDEAMNNGLRKGQIGMLIAASNAGKTTFLSMVAVRMARQGHKVLHIYFEDEREDMKRSYISALTTIPRTDLEYNTDKKTVMERLSKAFKGQEGIERMRKNLKSVKMEDGSVTVEMIEAKLRQYELVENWIPDVIVIDYLSCLAGSSNGTLMLTQEYQVWERCMKKLQALASRRDCVIWIGQQTNRDGARKETGGDNVANVQGSYRVIQTAAAVLYLDKSRYEWTEPIADLYLAKMRNGSKNKWEGIYFDGSNCQIDLGRKLQEDNILGGQECDIEDIVRENNSFYASIS